MYTRNLETEIRGIDVSFPPLVTYGTLKKSQNAKTPPA